MKILIAEDDEAQQQYLAVVTAAWGYEVEVVNDGAEAWSCIESDESPRLMLLDWVMPGMSGIEVCQKLRKKEQDTRAYVIMLTSMDSQQNIVAALDAGADDFVTKPFEIEELRARLAVGRRVLDLQAALSARVSELKEALSHVQTLQGILPVCMCCHKVRDEKEAWLGLEHYLEEHVDVQFSHGICHECMQENYPDLCDGAEGKNADR